MGKNFPEKDTLSAPHENQVSYSNSLFKYAKGCLLVFPFTNTDEQRGKFILQCHKVDLHLSYATMLPAVSFPCFYEH